MLFGKFTAFGTRENSVSFMMGKPKFRLEESVDVMIPYCYELLTIFGTQIFKIQSSGF